MTLSTLLSTGGGAKVVAFTSSGTWTCPTGVYIATFILAGGGGGGLSDSYPSANIYGGTGAQITILTLPVTPGVTYTVTIGSGGTGGASPTAGGQSSISGTGLSLTAAGGAKGAVSASGAGGGVKGKSVAFLGIDGGLASGVDGVIGTSTKYNGTKIYYQGGHCLSPGGAAGMYGTAGAANSGAGGGAGVLAAGAGGSGVAYIIY